MAVLHAKLTDLSTVVGRRAVVSVGRGLLVNATQWNGRRVLVSSGHVAASTSIRNGTSSTRENVATREIAKLPSSESGAVTAAVRETLTSAAAATSPTAAESRPTHVVMNRTVTVVPNVNTRRVAVLAIRPTACYLLGNF